MSGEKLTTKFDEEPLVFDFILHLTLTRVYLFD